MGERDGAKSARVTALAERFASARGLVVDVSENIEAAVWEKLLFVGPVSAVGAATCAPIGIVRGTSATRDLLAQAMAEVGAVARARGVRLPPDAVERALAYVDVLPADATASMQRDLAEGRRSELDSQVGAVVRLGKAASVPIPVHATIYACLLPRELHADGRAAR